MNVYQMNDVEWWIGPSLEECIADYPEQEHVDDDAHQLSDAELDGLTFTVVDGDEYPTGEERSFRQQMEIEVREGGKFPRMFASTDY